MGTLSRLSRALVIGGGSIGDRHVAVLRALGLYTAQLSRHRPLGPGNFHDVSAAFREARPDYVVIANATDLHESTLRDVRRDFHGRILVEKPLFATLPVKPDSMPDVFVGYNLRFHPGLAKLRENIRGHKIVSANAYVGSYLPNWRPDRDYRESYSARRADGGGVLRDLSHELDYLQWLFGRISTLHAWGGRLSALEIDSDDSYSMLMTAIGCPRITLEMNYVDRLNQRYLTVISETETWRLDFLNGELKSTQRIESLPVERNSTYEAMHRDLISERPVSACAFREGYEVLELIDAAEASSRDQRVIRR